MNVCQIKLNLAINIPSLNHTIDTVSVIAATSYSIYTVYIQYQTHPFMPHVTFESNDLISGFWILEKSGTISGSIKIDRTTERFENINEAKDFDPEFIDFYNDDDTDQNLWTKTIGEDPFFGNKIRNDSKW